MTDRLLFGDCLVQMQQIPTSSVDAVICDLPYNCTAHKWDKAIPLPELWTHYHRICKPDAIICLFGVQPFTSFLVLSNISEWRYNWIWEKESPQGFLNANYCPLKKTEDIVVFSHGTIGSRSKVPIRYFPQNIVPVNREKRNNPNSSYRKLWGYPATGNKLNSTEPYIQRFSNYPNTILKFARDKPAVHPTQKPVALLEYLIKTYTKQGETVLDNCMGSGSTGVACVNTNRTFIGIERDDRFFAIARERIEKAKKEFVGDAIRCSISR